MSSAEVPGVVAFPVPGRVLAAGPAVAAFGRRLVQALPVLSRRGTPSYIPP